MNIASLVNARIPRTGTLKASSWRAVMAGDERQIFHYAALMAVVRNSQVVQVGTGWGSMTDKCGIARIRKGARLAGFDFVDETK